MMRLVKFIFVIATLLFSFWALGFASYVALSLLRMPAKAGQSVDAIIVLTGGKSRIETGLKLFSEGESAQLFITGVHEATTREEIVGRWQGAPLSDCCITIGHKANTTTENALEAQEWLAGKDYKTIRLVTSNYHMNRALLEFSDALPDVKILPHPIMQPDITPRHEYFWHVIFGEYHKTIFRFCDIHLRRLIQVKS